MITHEMMNPPLWTLVAVLALLALMTPVLHRHAHRSLRSTRVLVHEINKHDGITAKVVGKNLLTVESDDEIRARVIVNAKATDLSIAINHVHSGRGFGRLSDGTPLEVVITTSKPSDFYEEYAAAHGVDLLVAKNINDATYLLTAYIQSHVRVS